MGITKTIGFSEGTNQMAEILKALGNPARLEIVKILMATPECICGDIVEILPLAQSTVSKHLSELKKVGIIKGSISGNSTCYCLDEKVIQNIQNFINTIESSCTKSQDCC
jgi:DNA-binding transcriptional ArsR family regulator